VQVLDEIEYSALSVPIFTDLKVLRSFPKIFTVRSLGTLVCPISNADQFSA